MGLEDICEGYLTSGGGPIIRIPFTKHDRIHMAVRDYVCGVDGASADIVELQDALLSFRNRKRGHGRGMA